MTHPSYILLIHHSTGNKIDSKIKKQIDELIKENQFISKEKGNFV
jgi:hypothetical protein